MVSSEERVREGHKRVRAVQHVRLLPRFVGVDGVVGVTLTLEHLERQTAHVAAKVIGELIDQRIVVRDLPALLLPRPSNVRNYSHLFTFIHKNSHVFTNILPSHKMFLMCAGRRKTQSDNLIFIGSVKRPHNRDRVPKLGPENCRTSKTCKSVVAEYDTPPIPPSAAHNAVADDVDMTLYTSDTTTLSFGLARRPLITIENLMQSSNMESHTVRST